MQGAIAPAAHASLPVHPLEIYFLLLAFTGGAFLLWLQPRKRYDGQVVLLFLALHEPRKFLLEFLRAQPAPHLQVLSLAFAVIAWSALLGRRRVAVRSTPPRDVLPPPSTNFDEGGLRGIYPNDARTLRGT